MQNRISATLGVKVILVSFTNDKNVMTLGIKHFEQLINLLKQYYLGNIYILQVYFHIYLNLKIEIYITSWHASCVRCLTHMETFTLKLLCVDL